MGSGAKNRSGSFGDSDTEGRGQHFGTLLFLGNGSGWGVAGGWEKTGLMSSREERARTPARCQPGKGQVHKLDSQVPGLPKINSGSHSAWPSGLWEFSFTPP